MLVNEQTVLSPVLFNESAEPIWKALVNHLSQLCNFVLKPNKN